MAGGNENAGFDFQAVPVDVTNYESCQQAIAKINKDVGPVDVLVNNAGITATPRSAKWIRMPGMRC